MQTTTSIRNLVGLIGWKTTCKAAHKGEKKNQRELFCLLSTATKILQGYRVGTGMYPQNKNLGMDGQPGEAAGNQLGLELKPGSAAPWSSQLCKEMSQDHISHFWVGTGFYLPTAMCCGCFILTL